MAKPVFRLASPWRVLLGLALLAVSAKMLLFGHNIDWGVGWTTWVPAAIMLIPAFALTRRKVLRAGDDHIDVETGWLWRRITRLHFAEWEIEQLPTARWFAVVIHHADREYALATWLSKHKADQLLQWLDGLHHNGGWPRRVSAKPVGDR